MRAETCGFVGPKSGKTWSPTTDSTRRVGLAQLAVRRFQITIDKLQVEIALDADGWPVETSAFRRVE
jgi:ribosomal protein L28